MTQTQQRQICFGPFVLDPLNARLLRAGSPVALTPKAFDVLHYLAARAERLVTKEELLRAVWNDVVVSEASIKVCIREIRRALGDDAASPTYIQTIHRRGHRFIGLGGEPAASEAAGPAGKPTPADADTAAATVQAERRPIVGREAELARLKQLASLASAGDRQIVFISASPGGGKTSLVEAFLAEVRAWQIGTDDAAGPALLVGHCFEQYGTSEPYLPLWEAITPMVQTAGPAVQTLRDLLSRHHAAFAPGLPASDPPATVPRAMSERLRRDLVDAIEEFARGRPLVVIVLEDLHWADYSTIDLLSALARRRSLAKLMVLATYRPGEVRTDGHPVRNVVPSLLSARLATELKLGHLDEPAVHRYLAERFAPKAEMPRALAVRLHHRTGGHPLFLANLVDDLVEQGLIVQSRYGWVLGGDQNSSAPDGLPPELDSRVPPTVRAMVEGQLSRLEPDERHAIEAAAVAGVEFSAAAVAAARPGEAAIGVKAALSFDAVVAAEEICEALADRHRFLVPVGETDWPDGSIATRYRFTHELYHNVVYGLIPAARRARMHLTLGERMEAVWQGRTGEIAAELAVHFEQGRDWSRAANYLHAAADTAIRHYAHREAVTYLRRAVKALDRLPPEQRGPRELAILMSLGVNLQVTRGFGSPKVQEVHARAYALCRPVTGESAVAARVDPQATFRVLWGIWVFHKVRSDLAKSDEMARQLIDLALQAGDPVNLLQAHQAMCVTALCRGDFQAAIEQTEAAAALYLIGQHDANTRLFGQDPGVATAAFGSVAYLLVDRPDDAARCIDRALTLARHLAQPSTLAVALHFAAMYYQVRDEAEQTERFARDGVALAVEEGFSFWHAGGRVLMGWSRAARKLSDGVDEIRRGIAAWLATGSRTYHSYYLGLLADACYRLGRLDEARAAVEEGLTVSTELGEGIWRRQLEALRQQLGAGDATKPLG